MSARTNATTRRSGNEYSSIDQDQISHSNFPGPNQSVRQELQAGRESEGQDGLHKKGALAQAGAAFALPTLTLSNAPNNCAYDPQFKLLDVVDDGDGPNCVGRQTESSQRRSRSRSPTSATHRRKRTRARSTSPLSGTSPPSKRTKPDASRYPWTAASRAAEEALRPELKETLRLLRVYRVDVEEAKNDLYYSTGAPEFPDEEWTNVLLGRVVDLDHVLSDQYPLGRTSNGRLVPANVIKTSSDWVIAWDSTSRAIAYAFPHRETELKGYMMHILTLFGCHPESLHHQRVINYDRAVRRRVAARRDILLTDFFELDGLRTQYLGPTGASVVGG